MTKVSLTMASRAVQSRESRLEQPPDFLVGDAPCAKALDGRRDERLSGAKLIGGLLGAAVRGHKRSRAVPKLDDAFVLELAVGLGHSVRVDHELLRERADARQLLARTQRAGFDAVLHLLHQLEIEGHAGRGVGPEQHVNCTTELTQYHCLIRRRPLSSSAK